ncbi:MAG TPA: hypothetical protein VMU02_05825 [bacterium]|nr:hypothetical protein [bacterium]
MSIVLSATTDKLQALSDASAATTEPKVVVTWADITSSTFSPSRSVSALNGTTAVDITAAPASSTQRLIRTIHVFNEDTATRIVTIRYNANGTTYILKKASLAAGDTLFWSPEGGWQQVSTGGGGGSTPTVVQSAINAGSSISTVTMGSAPTHGNLLICFQLKGNVSAGSGWHEGWTADSGGANFSRVLWKIAGAGESTTQTPLSTTTACVLAVFEVSGGIAGCVPDYGDATGTSKALGATCVSPTGIIIGAVAQENGTQLPSSISGATGGATATGSAEAGQLFTNLTPTQGYQANTITANYGSSAQIRMAAISIG